MSYLTLRSCESMLTSCPYKPTASVVESCAMHSQWHSQYPKFRIAISISVSSIENDWSELAKRKRFEYAPLLGIDVPSEEYFRKELRHAPSKPKLETDLETGTSQVVKAHSRVKKFVAAISRSFSPEPLLALVWTICLAVIQACFLVK